MRFKYVLSLVVLFLSIVNSFGQAATRWRGPQGNGIYPDKGLLKVWPADGPKIFWTFDELGQGHSSAIVVKDKVYVSGMLDNTGYIFQLSLNGELLWKKSYAPEFYESYPGTRSTPVVAGNELYQLSGRGQLVCMNAADGEIKWRKDLFKDFDGKNIRWGITQTMVVEGDRIYCTPGGKKHNIIALNRFTGDLIWTCPGKGEKTAYCTPLIFDHFGRKILVTMTERNIVGVDANTGNLLWSYPQTNRWSVHANTPIYHNGSLFCFSGYGQGGVKLKLSQNGESVKKEWFCSTMDNRIGGAVLVDGFIYGSGDQNRAWQCIDWETGEQKYSSAKIGKGVVIYADGMLYCYTERGELALVKADPSGFQLISKTKVVFGSEQHWAHPSIYNGVLYVRHGKSLIAYKIK